MVHYSDTLCLAEWRLKEQFLQNGYEQKIVIRVWNMLKKRFLAGRSTTVQIGKLDWYCLRISTAWMCSCFHHLNLHIFYKKFYYKSYHKPPTLFTIKTYCLGKRRSQYFSIFLPNLNCKRIKICIVNTVYIKKQLIKNQHISLMCIILIS